MNLYPLRPEEVFSLFLCLYAFAVIGYLGAAIAWSWRRGPFGPDGI